jgi:TolA-binding protein
MVGVTEAAAAAGIFSQVRKLLRELRQSSLSEQHQSLVNQMMELVSDGQDRLAEMQARIIDLQAENQTLRGDLAVTDEWQKRLANFQLFQTPIGGVVLRSIEQPTILACPRCAEANKEIHLLQYHGEHAGTYACANCRKSFGVHEPTELDPYEGDTS